MNAISDRHLQRGVALSDLHLFSGRSHGAACLETIRPLLESSTILVLNGDIFDFRWSTLRDPQKTVAAALAWLRHLSLQYPHCQIHYVMGNHDCSRSFTLQLDHLAASLPQFKWHEYVLRLGTSIFLHGDCTHRPIQHHQLTDLREPWRKDERRGPLITTGYQIIDRLGITQRFQKWHFPRQRTVERIVLYLDGASPGWRKGTTDCYFGHTHLPFENFVHSGIRFHNTGSAIRHMQFSPRTFTFRLEPALAPSSPVPK
jgi:UDP-2,3-diacylglucosamine hydrolase